MNNIFIRPLKVEDTNLVVRWRNSQLVRDSLFSQDIITCQSHMNYFKEQIETHRSYQFIIEQIIESINPGGCSVPVGTIFLKNIDYNSLKCEMGIFIGEEFDRGKGIGKEAVRLILEFGFKKLNMNKIYLRVLENNDIAINLYKHIGFHVDGILREDYFRDNKYYDVWVMSIIKKELF